MSESGTKSTHSSGKKRIHPELYSVEVGPDEDRLLKRSRTGCFTCRKRKKKCPEQYEGNTCLRCKAGGFRCIRSLDATDSTTQQAETHSHEGSSLNLDFGGTGSMPTKVNGVDAAVVDPHEGIQDPGLLSPVPLPVSGSSVRPTSSEELLTLDDLLSSSFPDLDLSQYENFGHIQPFLDFQPEQSMVSGANPEPITVDSGTMAELGPSPVSLSNQWLNPAWSLFIQSRGDSNEDLLLDFYDRYILPAWAVTYPPSLREAMRIRYHDVTDRYPLCRVCRKAAAAVYAEAFQQHTPEDYGREVDPVPPQYSRIDVDVEGILKDALFKARSPEDPNLSLEAHLWAFSDLHIAISGFCDANRALAVLSMAEHLVQVTYGCGIPFDVESRVTYSNFNLRAFAMQDLNRGLCRRRRTFFDFDSAKTLQAVTTGHVNDGSHDNWFGMSAGMVLLIARLSNAVADLQLNSEALKDAIFLLRVQDIESQLLHYRTPFSLLDKTGARHPLEYTAEMAVEEEIWRATGLLMLYRVVYDKSVFEEAMSRMINHLIDLLVALPILSRSRIARENNIIDYWSLFYTTPAFLVGSLLFDRRQRQFCRRFLRRVGPEKPPKDMLQILELTWRESDKAGALVDWFEEARKNGMTVTFM